MLHFQMEDYPSLVHGIDLPSTVKGNFLCYPSCALFSVPSCAVIILNGAPSSAPVYFGAELIVHSYFNIVKHVQCGQG